MNINVSVDGLDAIDLNTVIDGTVNGYDPETGETDVREKTLADLIAEKLADKIFGGLTYDNRHDLTKKADRERLAIIKAKVEPIIEQAIAGPIRLTNGFGEPTGAETTLNALIVEEAKAAIGGGRNDYGRGKTLAQRVVAEEVGRAFATELNTAVAEEKAKVVAAIRAKAADLIAAAVKEGVGR